MSQVTARRKFQVELALGAWKARDRQLSTGHSGTGVESQPLGRLRQKDPLTQEFETSLDNVGRPYLKKKSNQTPKQKNEEEGEEVKKRRRRKKM